jgi:hypothetical protein
VIEWEINTVNKRPELQLFDFRANKSKSQNTISKKVFTRNAYRLWKPNMLDNSSKLLHALCTGMCLIGINLKKKRGTISEAIALPKRNFQYQSSIKEMENEITKLQEITDAEISREYVVKNQLTQLRNGVITSSEYFG